MLPPALRTAFSICLSVLSLNSSFKTQTPLNLSVSSAWSKQEIPASRRKTDIARYCFLLLPSGGNWMALRLIPAIPLAD